MSSKPLRTLAVLATALAIAVAVPGTSPADTPNPPLGVDPGRQLHLAVSLSELPAPPTAPSDAAGSCTAAVNPHRTGCVTPDWGGLGAVGFYPDSHYTLAGVHFAGAPAAPDPASVYSGPQVLLVKTDGTTFANGDAWKCITCVPAANEQGVDTSQFTYPISGFHDGKRVFLGHSILDCGRYQLTDPRCTPDRIHIYPIRWNVTADGSGPGGNFRELRLNPDDTHLGWNYFGSSYTVEYGFMGKLRFDPDPTTGTPLVPRYDLTNVTLLGNTSPKYQHYVVHGSQFELNNAGIIGEFRGWTADGRAAVGLSPYESGSLDLWATDNRTGRSRPLTDHAEYVDPMNASPDGRWTLAEELLGTGRLDFAAGIQGIPPITDMLTTGYFAGLHDNGRRRFFLPYLVDRDADRSEQLNAGGDPNWNAAADPTWLADSTGVVWAENQVVPPACGGGNPLPCPTSSEPGGRHSRVMIARFPQLAPQPVPVVAPVPDTVAWGTPYTAGMTLPAPQFPSAGTYVLRGKVRGSARIVLGSALSSVAVTYSGYSDDGADVINGTESAAAASGGGVTLHENLTVTGRHTGAKLTSEPGGFTMLPPTFNNDFQTTGTLTTILDGHTYTQPGNGD